VNNEQFKNVVIDHERMLTMGNCKYCNDGYGLKSQNDDYCTLEIDDSERELSIWDGYDCTAIFTISYCPVCGRKLW